VARVGRRVKEQSKKRCDGGGGGDAAWSRPRRTRAKRNGHRGRAPGRRGLIAEGEGGREGGRGARGRGLGGGG